MTRLEIARPSPVPRVLRVQNVSKTLPRSAGGMEGPSFSTPASMRPPRATAPLSRRPFDGVLQQVRDDAPQLQLIALDRRQVFGNAHHDLAAFELRLELVQRPADEVGESVRLLLELDARLETRH